MRVAWITSVFWSDEEDYSGGGAIHDLAKNIILNSSIKLDIYSLYYPVNKPEYKFYNSNVFSFGTGTDNRKLIKVLIWRKLLKKFTKEHLNNNYDLIHSLWSNEPGHLAAKLSEKLNIPFIANIGGNELAELKSIKYGARLKYFQKKMVDNSFQSAIKIIIGSDFIADKIKNYYSNDIYKKTVKIPFGVDDKSFKIDDSKQKKGITLINLASAVPVKDHLTLFKAVKVVRLKYPEVIIKCFGRNIKKIYADYVNPQFFILNNFIHYHKIPEILNHSDIFVLSSLYESQNISMIEAGFCGLPIVSTDVGAARELTSNLVKPGDFEALAEKIIYVIEHFEEEKNKAIFKRDELVSKYSCEAVTRRFVELYKEIV